MKILSVNVGKPKSQIQVNRDSIEGDEFKSPSLHGTIDSVVYAMDSNRLNFVTGHSTMRDEFLNHDWPGIYFEVIHPGTIKPMDDLVLKKRHQTEISALDLYKTLRAAERQNLSNAQMDKFVNSPFVLKKYKDKLYRISGRAKPH